MEEKYNHGLIHLNAGTYIAPMIFKTDTFVLDEEYYSKVSIYIELSGSEEEGYIIIPEAHRPTMLLKGDYSKGGTATIITDFETLFNDRDLAEIPDFPRERILEI